MARDLTAGLTTQKNKLHSQVPWVWLVEIALSDSTSARITNFQRNVIWNQNLYYAFPFAISEVRQSAEGQLPTLTLTVPNVTREVQELLDANNGLTRKKLWLRLVNRDHLNDGSAVIEDRFTIQRASTNVNVVSFQLGRVDLFALETPRRKYRRDSCGHVYKDTVCRYSGDLATCDKTRSGPNGCIVHGDDEVANGQLRLHPWLYGGFPSIPKTRS